MALAGILHADFKVLFWECLQNSNVSCKNVVIHFQKQLNACLSTLSRNCLRLNGNASGQLSLL